MYGVNYKGLGVETLDMATEQPAAENRDSQGGNRDHLYLITSHPEDSHVGCIERREKRYEMAKKNEEARVDKLNGETGERFTMKVVGLGYHDFESDDPDEETFVRVYQEKLSEIDEDHLREAGLDPEEVLE